MVAAKLFWTGTAELPKSSKDDLSLGASIAERAQSDAFVLETVG